MHSRISSSLGYFPVALTGLVRDDDVVAGTAHDGKQARCTPRYDHSVIVTDHPPKGSRGHVWTLSTNNGSDLIVDPPVDLACPQTPCN